MKLRSDNKVIRLLGEAGSLIMINILVLLCSLPVVTAGPALAAGYACLAKREEPEASIVTAEFFREFKELIVPAVRIWLLLLSGLFVALGDLYYALWGAERISLFFFCFGLALLLTFAGIGVWLLPLLTYYENTVTGYLKSALYLAVRHLPSTILVWGIIAAFVSLPLVSVRFFGAFGWLYPLCGLSGVLYLSGLVLETHVRPASDHENPV